MAYLFSNFKWYWLRFLCLSVLIGFSSFGSEAAASGRTKSVKGCFDSLQKRLIQDGFNKPMITSLYSRPEVALESIGVPLFFKHSEAKVSYSRYYSKKSIRQARKYIKKHHASLKRTEKAYGVDKEVITAIMLVETRLGTVMGSRSVLNTLSTMAALADSENRDRLWSSVPEANQVHRKKFEKWSDRKSKWAYRELKSFLTYTTKEGMDPVGIKGSYAGAMGIAQFMPSNILALAKDGNRDGHIDLFNHDDAMASIANYLCQHGWQPRIEKEKAYNVLYRYNHSKYYVDALLKIAGELERRK